MHGPVKRAEPAKVDVFTKVMLECVRDANKTAISVSSGQKLVP
jgi:hypothetical protein